MWLFFPCCLLNFSLTVAILIMICLGFILSKLWLCFLHLDVCFLSLFGKFSAIISWDKFSTSFSSLLFLGPLLMWFLVHLMLHPKSLKQFSLKIFFLFAVGTKWFPLFYQIPYALFCITQPAVNFLVFFISVILFSSSDWFFLYVFSNPLLKFCVHLFFSNSVSILLDSL